MNKFNTILIASLGAIALYFFISYSSLSVKYSSMKDNYRQMQEVMDIKLEMEAHREQINKELQEFILAQEAILAESLRTIREIEYEYNSTNEGRECNTIPNDVLRLLQYSPRTN